MNIAAFTQLAHIFFLYFINIVEFEVFGWFWRWRQQLAFRGALIKALHAGIINHLAYGLTAQAAEVTFLLIYFCLKMCAFRNRQAAVKAVFIGHYTRGYELGGRNKNR